MALRAKTVGIIIEICVGLALIVAGLLINRWLFLKDPAGVGASTLTPFIIGLFFIAHGIVRMLPDPRAVEVKRSTPHERRLSLTFLLLAGLALGLGLVFDRRLGMTGVIGDVVVYCCFLLGAAALAVGLWLFKPVGLGGDGIEYVPGVGYRSFVAWRYLLDRKSVITARTKLALVILFGSRILLWPVFGVGIRVDIEDRLHVLGIAAVVAAIVVLFWGVTRNSRLAVVGFLLGVVVMLAAIITTPLALGARDFTQDETKLLVQILGIVLLSGFAFMVLSLFLGTLRAVFTFFTTVPIGGVWIGTAALVTVLAVMSGFETDLRDKILGSNAHIQVSKEDGEFVEWRDVKAKLDKIPGVVATTPFATSEVVIAANNNGMNVIIKGIDAKTVAQVTNLAKVLKTPGALQDLDPKRDFLEDRVVPQKPVKKDAVDPLPDDMPVGGEPIDFSGDTTPAPDPGPGSGSGSGSAAPPPPDGAGSAAPAHMTPAGDLDTEPVSPYGGDASRIVDLAGGVDSAFDSDLIRWATGEHDDYAVSDPAVSVRDISDPLISSRTRALPGILVGQELAKQTHLFLGQEVRVVSPLSDPSNPDATGTPIPFNRDYRVAGVFYTGMYEYDLKYVYVTLESLQDFLDLGDTVDGIEIRLESADDTEYFVPSETSPGLIRETLGPGYRVQDWRELNRSLFSALKLEKIAMFLVLGIVILVASFSIIGNLIMVVVEKSREIALLKTLGASDTGVMTLFAIQGMIIGLIGTALGIATGLALCGILDEFGLPLDPDVYYINRLPIHVDPQAVILTALTGVIISIFATLYPALLAARVRPAAGMRH